MAALETLIRVSLVAAMIIEITMAANHIVGGPNGGWDTNTNFQEWASSQNFSVGDKLIFQYPPNHDVVEVTKADYDSCQTTNPIQSYNDGDTTIPLTSPGKRYFICATLGHCGQGMKIEIDTLAGATSSTSPTESPSPAASPMIPVAPSAESPDFTNSAAESPEYVLAAPSPLFDTHLESPAFSPVIPSTEKSLDPSTASAKKGNFQAFITIVSSFLLVLLAS
ncbi:uclacyanin 1-like [Prosopis cineraria]|uniref:uclacyanin 1-like n=1 Tax=Prosopis cineraria TaxID=364024 RepID=UPI002410A3FB|nr:uclacyanin 1-like [Prosopis cineraria]XP_054814268.1 uclacyanin 1-like [Prosopis cineraria]